MSPVVRIPAATGGLDTESAPEFVADANASVLTNWRGDKRGKLRQRPGLSARAALGASVGDDIWEYDFGNGETRFIVSAGSAPAQAYLCYYATGILTMTGTVAYTAGLSENYVRKGDHVFGSPRSGKLVRWDGSTTITQWTNVPFPSVRGIEVFAERLFVAGSDKALYFSNPGGPNSDVLTEWQDNVSGLTNKIVIGSDIWAIRRCGTALAIFTRDTVSTLTGSGGASFTRRLVLQRGTISGRTVCAYGDGVFFLSTDGLFWFDGAQERKVSGPVGSRLVDLDGWAEVANAGHGYIAVTVAPGGGNGVTYLYNVDTDAWTQLAFDSTVMASGRPQQMLGTSTDFFMLDTVALWRASELTSPSAEGPGYDLVGATKRPIASSWQSKVVRLGTPFNKAHVRRVIVDYAMAGDDGNWTLNVYTAPPDRPDATGATPIKTVTLTAADSTLTRHRKHVDLHAEAENLWVTVTAGAAPTSSSVAELYDVWVEYDQAQQSRGY